MTQGLLLRVTAGPGTGTMASADAALVVGREGDLRVDDPTVSRRHVSVAPDGAGGLVVQDAGSSNGFSINGVAVGSGALLRPGDVLGIGRTELTCLRLIRHHEGPAGPHLLIDDGSGRVRAMPLAPCTTVGRDPSSDLVIDHPDVSRKHLTLHVDADGATLEDHSSNGTTVSGARARGVTRLADGDVIRAGPAPTSLTLHLRPGTAGAVTVDVRPEGAPRGEMTTVDAAPTATVAEVTLALATAFECARQGMLLYRVTDGVLLHPDDPWAATGPHHGDVLALGQGDASAWTTAAGRHWPRTTAARLNQLPRGVVPPTRVKVDVPPPPESLSWKGRGIMWQVIGGMGVVVMGLVMAIVRPEFALFGLMAGLIGLVAVAASIFGEQSRRRHRAREHEHRLADLDRSLAATGAQHAAQHRLVSPDLATLVEWVHSGSERLWERRPTDPDALRLRLGDGHRRLDLEVEDHHRGVGAAVGQIVTRRQVIGPTPVLGPGVASGSLGLVGDRATSTDLLRRMVVEAALLHPPHQLQVWVLAVDDQWQWCRWLPHTGDGGGRVSASAAGAARLAETLAEELAATSVQPGEVPALLHLVVVPSTWDRGVVQGLVGHLARRGVALVAAPEQRSLPNGLVTVIEADAGGLGAAVGDYPDAPVGRFALERLPELDAERTALALAQLAAGSGSGNAEGITELLGLGPVGTLDVAASWAAERRDPLTVAIGADASGEPVTVGFRRDGPHGMIAGTTGSGKSELLQTLLGALALTHRPDRLAMFLIDYKGGATFAPLATLPHVVGTVTDLENDSALATRAFTALDAEIMRRKRTLDDAGVPNIIDYERLDDPSLPPMPNLLVVIDEFALMVKSQPELKERLDTVATQGRSLGVHLLLATQSPTGVITHAVRTNTNLWISLRVVTDSESLELLGARDAARIPDGSPGRGFIRLGAGDHLRGFQAARIARPVTSDDERVRVTRSHTTTSAVARSGGRTELDVAVERIASAWAATGRPAPSPLWLPPLPTELPADRLPVELPLDRLVAAVGLADHPAEQRQAPHLVDLTASGHLAVAGVLGSGKTTTLLQVATDLAGRHSPDDLHLYAVDAGTGSLGPLAELPHCGATVGSHDAERLTRLLDRLGRLVDERRDALAAAGVGDFTRWRAAGATEPWVVLLIDDLPALREAAEHIEMGRLLDRFASLLQNGPSVGVHLVVSITQQIDLRMRESSLIPERILLRLTDPADYAMVEVRMRPGEVPPFPPGRGLVSGPTFIQVAEPSRSGIAAIAERWTAATGRRPRPVERLPQQLGRAALPPSDVPLRLGVGGPELDAVGVDLDRGAPVLLVAGPIQSGRSTALAAALAGILEREPARSVTVVALRPGPLRELTGERVTVVTSAADVPAALDAVSESGDPAVVVVDDAEGLAGQPGIGDRLDRLVRTAAERDVRVLVGARISDLGSMFEPWARFVVSIRRAVLLHPTQDDAFAFGVKVPTIPPPAVPGRGMLIDGSSVTVVQLASP